LRIVLPHLKSARALGGRTLVECTPAYMGRDPGLLAQLSQASGLQIITNVGFYGAAGGKYVPRFAYSETAKEIAARWIGEFRNGIPPTGIRPGFIKIGVDAGPLSEINAKLVSAAAITHLQTGLVIASHTGDGWLRRPNSHCSRGARFLPPPLSGRTPRMKRTPVFTGARRRKVPGLSLMASQKRP